MRLSIHFPTRARPKRALAMLEQYRRLASAMNQIKFTIVIDDNDPTMNNGPMLQRLRTFGRVVIGPHKSKVEACNSGIDRECDVILLASDDMTPLDHGWDRLVAAEMARNFPNLDGALHFNDGHTGAKLCTYPIMGINLFKKFGYVYHPSYLSLCCDNEFTEVLQALGRLAYVDRVAFRHDHHSFGVLKNDELYRRNDALMERDKQVYLARKAVVLPGAPCGFETPAIKLSILIASLFKRELYLRTLLADLNDQINCREYLRQVEIIVDRDGGEATIGDKRQRMLLKSRGEYIAFIDDDDGINPRYVDLVMAAIQQGEPDCASLVGQITTDGRNPREFRHSILYRGWYEEGGVYYRTPNHLNAVKRQLAVQAGFASERYGEDHAYSDRLAAVLRSLGRAPKEAQITDTLYHYRCLSNK